MHFNKRRDRGSHWIVGLARVLSTISYLHRIKEQQLVVILELDSSVCFRLDGDAIFEPGQTDVWVCGCDVTAEFQSSTKNRVQSLWLVDHHCILYVNINRGWVKINVLSTVNCAIVMGLI